MENKEAEQTQESEYLPFNEQLADECMGLTQCKEIYRNDIFIDKKRVHDWRNHVPEIIVSAWPELTLRERMLVAITAEASANNEDWD